MKTAYIGVQPGGGVFGWLVRVITRSRYGHALIRFGDTCFTAANRGWGWIAVSKLRGRTDWYALDVSDMQYEQMHQWCRQHMGWKYDWFSVIRFTLLWRLLFPSREAKRDRRKLFCSEGVYLCCLEAGKVALLGEVAAWEVAPAHFRFSSVLRRAK